MGNTQFTMIGNIENWNIEVFEILKCEVKIVSLYPTTQNHSHMVPHYSMSHCASHHSFQQM